MKYNSAGNELWSATLWGDSLVPPSLALDATAAAYVAGAAGGNYVVWKVGAEGDVLWESHGPPGAARDIEVDSSGNVLVTGESEGDFLTVKYSPVARGQLEFHRGDPNSSGTTDISDAITIFGFLFLGGPPSLSCHESADSNNDSTIDISDGIYLLNWLFTGGPEPVAPGPSRRPCGVDPDDGGSPGDLGCMDYPPCR